MSDSDDSFLDSKAQVRPVPRAPRARVIPAHVLVCSVTAMRGRPWRDAGQEGRLGRQKGGQKGHKGQGSEGQGCGAAKRLDGKGRRKDCAAAQSRRRCMQLLSASVLGLSCATGEQKAWVALTQASSHCAPDAKILKRQARALGVLSHRSAGEDKEHCDISRLKISPIIRKHSATKPVEILKRATARKNKVRSRRPTPTEHAGSLVVWFGIDASCQSKPNMTRRRRRCCSCSRGSFRWCRQVFTKQTRVRSTNLVESDIPFMNMHVEAACP